MKKLVLLAITLACVGKVWAQSRATPSEETRTPIDSVEEMVKSPELTWSYREEIRQALSRNDLDLSMDHGVDWLTRTYLLPGRAPTNLKEAKAQEKHKANTSKHLIASIHDYIRRVDRAKVLLTTVRNSEFRDPREFHAVVTELITIGRSHISFGFEQVIAWEIRRTHPSCQIPFLKGMVEGNNPL